MMQNSAVNIWGAEAGSHSSCPSLSLVLIHNPRIKKNKFRQEAEQVATQQFCP